MINYKIKAKAKEIMSKLAHDSARARYLAYLARFETWRKSRTEDFPTFENRYLLYDHLNKNVLADEAISYLEFGVSKGESLKYWTEINRNADSRFFGFDTFYGLPDKWEVFTTTHEENTFSMNGKPLDIGDERNEFVIGLFQETLPSFLNQFEKRGRLIVHCDADLYSSTLYVQCRCTDIPTPGSIVIFDEFSSVLHEFRAWEDYCASFLRDYVVLGATKGPDTYFTQIAVEMK